MEEIGYDKRHRGISIVLASFTIIRRRFHCNNKLSVSTSSHFTLASHSSWANILKRIVTGAIIPSGSKNLAVTLTTFLLVGSKVSMAVVTSFRLNKSLSRPVSHSTPSILCVPRSSSVLTPSEVLAYDWSSRVRVFAPPSSTVVLVAVYIRWHLLVLEMVFILLYELLELFRVSYEFA